MGRTFTILLCLLMFSALSFGQNTGKIAGVVVDRETGEPLVGANIVIVGLQMGAAVDVDGDFFILGVTCAGLKRARGRGMANRSQDNGIVGV